MLPAHYRVAAPYLRVSTDIQRDRDTVVTQAAVIGRFCARHGLTQLDPYIDIAISGTTALDARPAGAHLLHDLRRRRADLVLVYAFDRLARDPDQGIAAARRLLDLGVDLRSVTQPDIDLRTAHGWSTFVDELAFAAEERSRALERSYDGTDRLAREGAWLGGIVPFGYRVDKPAGQRRPGVLRAAHEPLPGLDCSEADVVRMIFRWSGEQGWSCMRIADRLNELGVPTVYSRDGRAPLHGKRRRSTSGVWRPGRVRSMLTNPVYRGLHHYGRRSARPGREIITREVAALVEPALWEQAQATLSAARWAQDGYARSTYLLRGLLRCARCGLSYVGIFYRVVDGQRTGQYACSGRHNRRKLMLGQGGTCSSGGIGSAELDQAIWQDVLRVLARPAPVLDALAERLAGDQATVDRLRDEAGLLKAGLRDAHAGAAAALQAQIQDRLEAALALEQQAAPLHAAMALLREPPADPDALSIDRRRALLATLIEHVTLDIDPRTDRFPSRQAVVSYRSGAQVRVI